MNPKSFYINHYLRQFHWSGYQNSQEGVGIEIKWEQVAPEFISAALLLTTEFTGPEFGLALPASDRAFMPLTQLLVMGCALRVLWNAALLIHGLGHSLTQALVERNPRVLSLETIFEHRDPRSVGQSCLLFQPIFVPAGANRGKLWLDAGDKTPWKIHLKAGGGILFNGAAIVAACWVYLATVQALGGSNITYAIAWARVALIFWIVANGVLIVALLN